MSGVPGERRPGHHLLLRQRDLRCKFVFGGVGRVWKSRDRCQTGINPLLYLVSCFSEKFSEFRKVQCGCWLIRHTDVGWD